MSALKRPGAIFAAFAVVVALGLYYDVIRPQYRVPQYPWPGHAERFSLPTFLPGDCPFYRATIVSLLRDRDLDLKNNMAWNVLSPEGQVALGARGEWFPKHPVGLSLAGLPFYAVLGDDGLLLFNVLQLIALDLLIVLLARRYTSDSVAFAIGFAWAFGTMLRPAAYNFAPDVLSTLLVVAGALALLKERAAAAGALLSAAVAVKWTNLAFLPIGAVYVLFSEGWRRALSFSIAAVPVLLALGALNLHMFGSPLITPYDHVLTLSRGAPAVEPSHREAFDLPFFRTLWQQLIDPQIGLLRSVPFIVLAPFGFALLAVAGDAARRREAALLLALCVSQIAIFAPYRHWQASSYGHRFLLTVVALAAAPVAALVQWLVDRRDAPA